jgi:hypothetical protein
MEATRDEKGRFLPGHALAGPGRPPRSTEADYARVTVDSVSPDEWADIMELAKKDAMNKRSPYVRQMARKWLAEYLIGKPPTVLDIRATDAALIARAIEALKTLGQSPNEVFEAIIRRADEQARQLSEKVSDER